jgi:hypothetical protein
VVHLLRKSIALAASLYLICGAIALAALASPALAREGVATFGGSDGSTGPTFPNAHSVELIVPDAVHAPSQDSDNIAQAPLAGPERPVRSIGVQRLEKEQSRHVGP